MGRTRLDIPGRLIFLSGVALVIAATILGLYLATPRHSGIPPSDWILRYDMQFVETETASATAEVYFSSNAYALMWMTFGLGVALTFFGLRLLTRPDLDDQPSKPMGSIRDVFENPE